MPRLGKPHGAGENRKAPGQRWAVALPPVTRAGKEADPAPLVPEPPSDPDSARNEFLVLFPGSLSLGTNASRRDLSVVFLP